jgi:phosphatidylserine/phosphatidylglycerophosphate/cardiolipin synthase-like enzyme
MAVEGELAAILGELGRARWKCATGEDLPPIESPSSLWPEELEPHFTNVDLAVARTRAAWEDNPEVRESEALFLDMIASAKRFIYAENQYFASPRIAAAIARRMSEADPPEIVIVSPLRSDGWLEQKAMDATRVRLCQFVGRADTRNRFRIYNPVTEAGQPIYVHAKVMIVDDHLLRVGSSNMNNRSLGLDSECDLAIEASDERQSATIAGVRTRLMAEHLGASEEVVAATFAKERSLIGTIQALQRGGRTLELLEFEEPGEVEKFVAETELLDPKSPDMMFENMTKRTLFSGLRRRVDRP